MGGTMGKRQRFTGKETVAAVEAILQSGNGSRKAAFEQVAKEIGRSPNSIAVTFYRNATKGVTRRGRTAGRTARKVRSPLSKSLRKVLAALDVVANALRGQQNELDRLRRENIGLQEIRKLIG